ncbi:F-actin-monooxygenase mical2-like [Heptranchias perlo]|uniref:F-actin-monooxygenase mical2-like n=1 Tax=Heptranchias perlo TaxID=212740 RepID=UPI00355A485B
MGERVCCAGGRLLAKEVGMEAKATEEELSIVSSSKFIEVGADFTQLNEKNVESNNQMAFDIAERDFGISPIMTGKEMASVGEPDKLSMVMYLSQFYEMLKDTAPEEYLLGFYDKSNIGTATKSPISFLSRLGQTITRKRGPRDDGDPSRKTNVKLLANQLLSKYEEHVPGPSHGQKRQRPNLSSQEHPVQQPYSRQRDAPQLAAIPRWKQRRDVQQSRACPKTVIMLPWPVPGPSRCTQVTSQHGVASFTCVLLADVSDLCSPSVSLSPSLCWVYTRFGQSTSF